MLLISSVWLMGSSLADKTPKRDTWDQSRAVKLAAKLQTTDIFWMYPVNKDELVEPGMPAPAAVILGRRRRAAGDPAGAQSSDEAADGNAASGRQSGSGLTSSGDPCMDATIIVHHYPPTNGATAKTPIIISDLTNALVKDPSTANCVCAEDDATPHQLDNRMLCIKGKDSLKKGEECIHNAECKDGLVCIFDALKNGNHGDIEDARRYCSDAVRLAGTAALVIIAWVLFTRRFMALC